MSKIPINNNFKKILRKFIFLYNTKYIEEEEEKINFKTRNSVPYGRLLSSSCGGCSLWLHWKGSLGQKVNLPARRTEGGWTYGGQKDNRFKGG